MKRDFVALKGVMQATNPVWNIMNGSGSYLRPLDDLLSIQNYFIFIGHVFR